MSDFVQVCLTISGGTRDEMLDVAKMIEYRAQMLANLHGMRCQATIDEEQEFPQRAPAEPTTSEER